MGLCPVPRDPASHWVVKTIGQRGRRQWGIHLGKLQGAPGRLMGSEATDLDPSFQETGFQYTDRGPVGSAGRGAVLIRLTIRRVLTRLLSNSYGCRLLRK